MSLTKTPRSGAIPLAAQPAPPSRLYSFTGWQASNPTAPPPGDRMDADYDNTNTTLTQTLSWAATSLNTDGSLKAGSVGQSQLVSGLFDDIAQDIIDEVQPLVDQAQGFASAAGASSLAAQASATAADHSNTAVAGTASTATAAANTAIAARNTAQTYATTAQTAATNASNADNHAEGAAALAQDYADVTQAWAEHMPDTIPPNILAVMGVTGDHWSSRWWANRAASIVSATTGAATVFVSDSPPINPASGQLWFDSSSPELYVWYTDPNSSEWVIAAGNGGRGSVSFSLSDFLPSGQPDGVTDLTVYIQQAINAAAGHGTLVIPANVNAYVTGTVYIPSNTHLIIEAGATLFLKAGATGNMFLISDNAATQLGANNIYIELRGTLDGNAFNQTALPSAGIVNYGLVTNLYVDGFCQGLITNFANWPFSVVRCTNAEVRNLAMTNSNNSCEFASQPLSGTVVRCYNVGFTNCYIKDIRDVGLVLYGGVTNGYIRGCYLDGSSASLYLDSSHPDGCVDCEISGCFAYNGFASIGVVAVIAGHTHDNARIFNNTIENSGAGGLTISAVDYCEVYGNTVHNTGMQFATASGQCGQVIISGATHVNFHDNAVRNPITPGNYSRQTTNTIASLVSYNPTTGAVSLTTTAAHPILVGDPFRIFNAFGSGDYPSLNGFWTATAGTASSTVNFTGPVGLTLATLKSGTINKYTNAVAVTIASGTYDPSTGNVVLTTSAPHGMPMNAGVPQPFVVSGITGTGAVANLNGYQTATSPGTTGSTITFTTTAGYGAITITGGTVLPPSFGVSITQTDYLRITDNNIGDWQATKNMVACIGGTFSGGSVQGLDGYTEGNVYGPRLATGQLYNYPADAIVYVPGAPIGSTQGVSYDSVQDVYYGTPTGRNISTQTFFPNKGLTIGWNLNSGKGDVDFLCGQELGAPGGFAFLQVANSGTINASVGVAGSLLANDGYGNTQLGGALVHGKMQTVASLANAGTVTVNQHTSMVLIRNSASIASATIVMPATAASQYATGAEMELNFQNAIGALTWSPAISGAPTTIATAGSSVNFINSGTVWLRRIAI